MEKRIEKERIRFYDTHRADLCVVARFLPFVWSEEWWAYSESGHARNVWLHLAPQNRIVVTSTSVRKGYAHLKVCKFNKVAIFNGIILIQVACSSLPCTLSLYNAFMWTVSVKAGQSDLKRVQETNEGTKEQRKEQTHHVTFLNLYIDNYYFCFLGRFSWNIGKYCKEMVLVGKISNQISLRENEVFVRFARAAVLIWKKHHIVYRIWYVLQREDGARLRLRSRQDRHGHHVLPSLERLCQLPQVRVSLRSTVNNMQLVLKCGG